ncbi:MAG: hypothetical protein IKP67_01790, partial [Spirochaetales bacterium]|nr:hypothetical protein [Spirochaetales bacterium]
LKFKYKFRNPGNTTYGINKATVTLKTIPLGTVDASEIASITKLFIGQINSKQESQVYETECQLSTQMLDQVMKRSAGFTLEVSGYETSLVNSIGSDYKTYNEVLSRVKSQTAALFIDYGYASGYRGNGYCFGYGVTYNVAAKNQFNKDSTTVDDMYFQNDLEYVFNTLLDMSGDYELSDEGYIKSINGVANAADIKDGAWYIGHKYTEGGKRYLKTYSPYTGGDDKTHWSLSNIKISAGDEISIIYAKDADNDGVPLNEEIMYGTDDTKSDTDGDGLSDYEEIYGWYKDGIGLDAKYSDSNKVYTNPKLADTDGDGLSDYSADSTKQDSDPINSERADDTRLRCRYAQTLSGSLTDFSFGDDDTYTIDNIGDKIYLDITPIQLSAATVQYKLGNDGEYKTLGKTDKISLNLGENKIYIRCTAPDHTTYKDYVLTANSNFNKMKDFKAEAPKYNFDADWNEPHIFSCALVYLNWSTYDDERACVPDGGYVLYGKKESSVRNNVSLPRDFETSGLLAGIEDLVFERYVNYKDEFYVKLSSDDLFKGAYPKEIDLRQNTNYSFYLFAYTGADSESAYRYELLGSANVKTGTSRYAQLNIYGHYFYDKEDHDGTYDPDYYWGFCAPKSAYESLPQGAERVPYIPSIPDVLNFSAFNHCDLVLSHGLYTGLKRDSIEFDDDDDKSYCFGEGKIHKYGDDPKKFSNCTKVVSTIFDRTQNYSFTETFEAWEIDFWESDYLGKVTANFTYTSATDTWTCSWSSTTGQKAGSAITAGQRTGKDNGSKDDGLRWE